MKIEFNCTKICGKGDFEELRNCKHKSRSGTGLRVCNNQRYVFKTLLDYYEEKYDNFRTINNIKSSKNLGMQFICDRCINDWANCPDRKGNVCGNGYKIRLQIEDIINKYDKNLLNNERLYKYACEKMIEIKEQIKLENDGDKKPYLLNFKDIEGFNKRDVVGFLNVRLRMPKDKVKKRGKKRGEK